MHLLDNKVFYCYCMFSYKPSFTRESKQTKHPASHNFLLLICKVFNMTLETMFEWGEGSLHSDAVRGKCCIQERRRVSGLCTTRRISVRVVTVFRTEVCRGCCLSAPSLNQPYMYCYLWLWGRLSL